MSKTLNDLVPPGTKAALVDVPNYENCGDAAILLGELNWLNACGISVGYMADQRGYRPEHLKKWVPKGPILLQGGGNFGNTYERHMRLRERVLQDCKSHKVILLPQSIHFTDDTALERTKRLIGEHGNVVLLARSRRSYDRMRSTFHADVRLCPDAAMFLDVPQGMRTSGAVGLLLRRDYERVKTAGTAEEMASLPDWPAPSRAFNYFRLGSRVLSLAADKLPAPLTLPLDPLQLRYLAAVSRRRLGHATSMFAHHSVVLTDRLHGHILATVMGIPNVALDNSSGKISDFCETWTKDLPHCRFADDMHAALTMGEELLQSS